jgi:hypothetical protein
MMGQNQEVWYRKSPDPTVQLFSHMIWVFWNCVLIWRSRLLLSFGLISRQMKHVIYVCRSESFRCCTSSCIDIARAFHGVVCKVLRNALGLFHVYFLFFLQRKTKSFWFE